MTLIAVTLGSMTGCLVTAKGRAGGGGGPPPPPAERNEPAQITGMVINSVTHGPVERAAIDITGATVQGQITTATDGSGHYETQPLPPGHYTVRVRRKGFQVMLRDFDLRPGETRLDVEMTPDGSDR
jgi:hypothetical protein